MIFYHGTDLDTARLLLAQPVLDPALAAKFKIDGPPGFFIATVQSDAEFFAVRQRRGPGVVLLVDIAATALASLLAAGAIQRPIPRGQKSPRFSGDELFIPTDVFDLFNALCQSGEIQFRPT